MKKDARWGTDARRCRRTRRGQPGGLARSVITPRVSSQHTHASGGGFRPYDTGMNLLHTMHPFGCSTYTITAGQGRGRRARRARESAARECTTTDTDALSLAFASTRVHTNSPPTGAWILRLCSSMCGYAIMTGLELTGLHTHGRTHEVVCTAEVHYLTYGQD